MDSLWTTECSVYNLPMFYDAIGHPHFCLASSPGHSQFFNVTCRSGLGPRDGGRGYLLEMFKNSITLIPHHRHAMWFCFAS